MRTQTETLPLIRQTLRQSLYPHPRIEQAIRRLGFHLIGEARGRRRLFAQIANAFIDFVTNNLVIPSRREAAAEPMP